MSGKNFHLTPLESRKQLLLVESELNRLQLVNELQDFKVEIHQLKEQVQIIGSFASSAAKLVGTFSNISDLFTKRGNGKTEKTSWLTMLMDAARMGSSIWETIRSNRK